MSRAGALVVLAITLGGAVARAHVAPSVDDNNRYLKLTPLGDRVRLAYTVFFGEVPGAQVRPQIDANHDGMIEPAESQAFADKLAAEIAAGLDLTVDGTTQPVAWTEVVVGMASPQTAAGTFSIDLIAWICLPAVRGAHQLQLHDRFHLPRPGETEIKVEDSPGVTIERARLGPGDSPDHDYRLLGPGGPLADDGLDLRFVAGAKAVVAADGACKAAIADSRDSPRGLIALAVAVIAGTLAGAAAMIRRRRRAHNRRK